MPFMRAYCLCLIMPATFCQNISSQRPETYLLQPHSQHTIVHYVSIEKNRFFCFVLFLFCNFFFREKSFLCCWGQSQASDTVNT